VAPGRPDQNLGGEDDQQCRPSRRSPARGRSSTTSPNPSASLREPPHGRSAPSSAKQSFSRTVQPQLARAHVAEPEQTRDQLGIKRAVTGVQQVKAQ
jgi:hypothetical protein